MAASVVALVNFIPARSLGKYYDYRDMNADLARFARGQNFADSLVFIRGPKEDFQKGLILNPPTLDSQGTIYARDLGPESRSIVMGHFQDRRAWIVGRSSNPREPYRVIAGPSVLTKTPGVR